MDLKFVPFSSEIELPFYAALFASKLDHDKLSDSARQVIGLYEPQPHAGPEASSKLQIHGAALTSHHVPKGVTRAEGFIKNVNTIEDFRTTDKNAMLKNAAKQIWNAIQDGSIYEVPSLLSSFVILSYADLKKYRFTYWFGFPALHSDPQWKRTGHIGRLGKKETLTLVDEMSTWFYRTDNRQHGFFLAKKVPYGEDSKSFRGTLSDTDPLAISPDEPDPDYKWVIGNLGQFEQGFFDSVEENDRFVGFVDPSSYADSPSWPLRNLLILIRQRFHMDKVQIICYRDTHSRRHEPRSIILPLAIDKVANIEIPHMPKVTGWERNPNGDLKARVANLAEYMDPKSLADQAVDLNLKLMKWRISPNLNLDVIKDTRCLLLGAGTLGSYVSRNLMGWGVRKITFVDYGSVSFSNPVRQPLFVFDDCHHGGKPKALQAAEALKAIYPGVEAEGHVLSVPMLGHPILDEAKMKIEFAKLHKLIDEHDVIFLLMDSRESRWLPTVMGKSSGKIVINAALGFDTYVVMRHGPEPKGDANENIGCYFCNDVVIAGNSMKDQTLDQQCTVTRPGVATIASALSVELLVSILQHPRGQHAPAPVPVQNPSGSLPEYDREPTDHPLGIVPHQIRGFLSSFQNMLISGKAFPQCSACSAPILKAYRDDPWGFLKHALDDREFVAELSGLAEVQRAAEKAAAEMEWSDDEEGGDDGMGGEGDEGVLVENSEQLRA